MKGNGTTRGPGEAAAAPLTSAAYEVDDLFAANEIYQATGWTDGLPIVPPTDALVRAFLDAARLRADAVIGVETVRRRRITAEKAAIAAVMAADAVVSGIGD